MAKNTQLTTSPDSDQAAKADEKRKALEDAQREQITAQASQRLADKAKQDAGQAANAAVSEAIYESGLTAGPSLEAAAGQAVYDDGSKAQVEATPKAVHSGNNVIQVQGVEADLLVLTRKAVELNVLVDPKWDVERLRGEIQMAREGRADLQVKGVVPTPEQSDPTSDPATAKDLSGVEMTVLRAYWPEEDVKKAVGDKIKVSKEEAQRLHQAGIATAPLTF